MVNGLSTVHVLCTSKSVVCIEPVGCINGQILVQICYHGRCKNTHTSDKYNHNLKSMKGNKKGGHAVNRTEAE